MQQPDDAKAHYNRGIELHRQRRLAEAIAEFRSAIRFNPKFAEAHKDLGNALQAALSPDDLAIRQRNLEFLHPRVRHLRDPQVEGGEVLQWREEHQPRVRHLRVAQAECSEVLQCGQFLQPRVRHPRLAQAERDEVLECGQFLQSRVCDLRAVQVERGG